MLHQILMLSFHIVQVVVFFWRNVLDLLFNQLVNQLKSHHCTLKRHLRPLFPVFHLAYLSLTCRQILLTVRFSSVPLLLLLWRLYQQLREHEVPCGWLGRLHTRLFLCEHCLFGLLLLLFLLHPLLFQLGLLLFHLFLPLQHELKHCALVLMA